MKRPKPQPAPKPKPTLALEPLEPRIMPIERIGEGSLALHELEPRIAPILRSLTTDAN
jgi:hypothetical protein